MQQNTFTKIKNWPFWFISYLVSIALTSLSVEAQTLAWQGIYTANPTPVDQSLGNSTGNIADSAPDGAGNLIMVGSYSNIINFPKVGGGNIQLVSDFYSTMFIGKWNISAQAWVWVYGTKGATGQAIALNGSDIYVTGTYGGSNVTIAGTKLPDKPTNDSDAFIAKYTDKGNTLDDGWAISFGGTTVPSSDYGRAIAINGTSLYVAGGFYGTATIAGTTLTSGGQSDVFLAKYDISTSPATGRWAVGGGDVRSDQANAIAVSGNNVYIGGTFSKNLVLSGTTLTTDVIQNRDLFLAKFVDNGTTVSNGWALSNGGASGTGGESVSGMRIVGSDIYFTGFYASAGATIAGVTLSSSYTQSTGQNMYVGKYTDAGSSATPRWATGVTTATNYSQGNDVAINGPNVYVTGIFAGTDVIAGTSLTSSGTIGGDSFVAQYTDNGGSVTNNGAIAGGSPVDSDQAYTLNFSGGFLYALGYAHDGAVFGSYTLQSTGISIVPLIAKIRIPAVATSAKPTVTTNNATNITVNSAVLGGNVTADGGAAVLERGVFYQTGTAAETKVAIDSGTGSFSQLITGLNAGTTYSVRAYATNSAGTSYGSTSPFTTPPNAPAIA